MLVEILSRSSWQNKISLYSPKKKIVEIVDSHWSSQPMNVRSNKRIIFSEDKYLVVSQHKLFGQCLCLSVPNMKT